MNTPKPRAIELLLSPVNNHQLANLCGALDENLRQIETALDVSIARRGERFTLRGEREQTARASEALQLFYARAKDTLSIDEIQLGLIELLNRPPRKEALVAGSMPTLMTRKTELHGRTPRQIEYLKHIQEHDITFGTGPAGTGKTYLAVASAVDAFEREHVQRIVLTRPAVEAGERLGFLPGDLAQKIIRICGRSTMPYTTSWVSTRSASSSSVAPSRSRRLPTCAVARSTTLLSFSTRRRTRRPNR